MRYTNLDYQVVRCTAAADLEHLDVAQLAAVFRQLDDFAAGIDGGSELIAEATHALADVLRGLVVAAHGIDVQPVSELGPHDDVDLDHSMGVLSRLVLEIQRNAKRTLQVCHPPEERECEGGFQKARSLLDLSVCQVEEHCVKEDEAPTSRLGAKDARGATICRSPSADATTRPTNSSSQQSSGSFNQPVNWPRA